MLEFSETRYEDAARSFLAAADLVPSKQALANALKAARRGDLPLLTARAAERTLTLADIDEAAQRAARAALEQATPKLARIALQCAPQPCRVYVDGEPATTGLVYLMPGTHELEGEDEKGQRVTVPVSCGAGSLRDITLELAQARDAVPPPADAQPGPEAKQEVPAPASTADAGAAPVPKTPRVPLPEPDTAERRNRLPLSVFVGAATGTLAFAALTTWAGAKAVSEKRSHPYDPNYDDDEVRRWARRADYFLIGTVVFAGATAATGIWWVDFRPAKRTRVALLPSRGVTLMAETRF